MSLDIQASYISNSKINYTLMRKTGYSPKIDSVKKTVALLKKSERPLFFIGTGARLSGCKDLLKVIINKFLCFSNNMECYGLNPL